MRAPYETEPAPPRALLIEVAAATETAEEQDSLIRELRGLVKTLGLAIAGEETVRPRERHPRYGMGTGKAEELAARAQELAADCLIFDGDLSPSQQRNWETLTGLPVLDRQELILRIFAAGARTREAELQVALARLTYSLPRLTHKYLDLSRQRGGHYGSRGSGETKLETDRRRVEARIHRLKGELAQVRRQRGLQRRKREKAGAGTEGGQIPACALVGYTNAGKSALLNALTGAELLEEDKLFATLDATARRLKTGPGETVILIDTVGFIRRLPHALVDAFRSTLEEAARADLLLHVLDAADPDVDRHYATTRAVLEELDAGEVPTLVVLNKIDLIDGDTRADLTARYPGSVPVSARARTGLEELRSRLRAVALPGVSGDGVTGDAAADDTTGMTAPGTPSLQPPSPPL